jgi:hypothetical protein
MVRPGPVCLGVLCRARKKDKKETRNLPLPTKDMLPVATGSVCLERQPASGPATLTPTSHDLTNVIYQVVAGKEKAGPPAAFSTPAIT